MNEKRSLNKLNILFYEEALCFFIFRFIALIRVIFSLQYMILIYNANIPLNY